MSFAPRRKGKYVMGIKGAIISKNQPCTCIEMNVRPLEDGTKEGICDLRRASQMSAIGKVWYE